MSVCAENQYRTRRSLQTAFPSKPFLHTLRICCPNNRWPCNEKTPSGSVFPQKNHLHGKFQAPTSLVVEYVPLVVRSTHGCDPTFITRLSSQSESRTEYIPGQKTTLLSKLLSARYRYRRYRAFGSLPSVLSDEELVKQQLCRGRSRRLFPEICSKKKFPPVCFAVGISRGPNMVTENGQVSLFHYFFRFALVC